MGTLALDRDTMGLVRKAQNRYHQKGQSVAEIAEALGISVNSVKSLKKEMYSKLRDMLEDEYLVLLVAHFLEKKSRE